MSHFKKKLRRITGVNWRPNSENGVAWVVVSTIFDQSKNVSGRSSRADAPLPSYRIGSSTFCGLANLQPVFWKQNIGYQFSPWGTSTNSALQTVFDHESEIKSSDDLEFFFTLIFHSSIVCNSIYRLISNAALTSQFLASDSCVVEYGSSVSADQYYRFQSRLSDLDLLDHRPEASCNVG
jgi:hypothetical protein